MASRNAPHPLGPYDDYQFQNCIKSQAFFPARPSRIAFGMTTVLLADHPVTPQNAHEALAEMEQWIADARQYLDDLKGGVGMFGLQNAVRPQEYFGPEPTGTGFED